MSNLTALIIWAIGCAAITAIGVFSYKESKDFHKRMGE